MKCSRYNLSINLRDCVNIILIIISMPMLIQNEKSQLSELHLCDRRNSKKTKIHTNPGDLIYANVQFTRTESPITHRA